MESPGKTVQYGIAEGCTVCGVHRSDLGQTAQDGIAEYMSPHKRQ
jgi:hypothetical protein